MTRRLLLAALLALAACSPAAASAAPAPSDFEQAVPAAAAAGAARAAGGPVATPPVAAPKPFDLLGLRWAGSEEAHVDVRVQRADGRWSRWAEIPHAEDVPAGERRGQTVTGPLWTGRAVGYQLRAEHGLPRGVRAHFVSVPRSATAGAATAAASARARAATTGAPPVVPRSQWDPTNACPPREAPAYGRVDFSVVHHTESLSSYSRASVPAMVLAMCRFHRNSNGWNDLGYNLLIDRYGVVYEGRDGGISQPVIGAHAGGWNSLSTGVSMIGSFTSSPPTAAAQRSLVRVLAWKLAQAGVPATGKIAEVSPGGDENRWPRGTTVHYERIVGHRDADHTACPGAALYALLPSIRSRVARQLEIDRAQLTSSPIGGVLAAGGPALLTGRLTLAGGRRPVGATLTIQQRGDDGAWVDVDTVRTRTDGIWSAALDVETNAAFRVVDPTRGVRSPVVEAEVAAGVTLDVSPQVLRRGRAIALEGETTPAKPQVTVLVERRLGSGSTWARVRRLILDTDEDGAYAASVTLSARGVHRVRVATAPDDLNAAGSSPTRTANVR